MSCKAEAYETIAQELQNVSGKAGYKTWVGIPEFVFDAPEPILIDKYVKDTIAELKKRGFTGDDIFIASHSLGGVISQMYVKDNSDLIKGQILMGSTLTRDHHSITDKGTTLFDYKTPTLQLSGVKDGLLRISRGAEAFWHQEKNIDKSQKGMFPVIALDDVSHASFMDSSMIPSFVQKSDLKADIDETKAHNQMANAMTSFIGGVLGNDELSEVSKKMKEDTEKLLEPFLAMMEQETLNSLKPACYKDDLVNPESKICAHGSQWTKTAQKIMGGDISWADADI